MIAVGSTASVYTEPVPVNAAVNEPQQSAEREENEEIGAFAKLLEGMLKNADENQIQNLSFDSPDTEISLDALIGENSDSDFLSLSNEVINFSEHDFSGNEFHEILNSMHETGLLSASLTETETMNFDADVQQIENINIFQHAGLKQKTVSSAVYAAETAASQTASAEETAEVSINAEKFMADKKTAFEKTDNRQQTPQTSAKSENTETLSLKNVQREDIAALNNRPESEKPGRLEERGRSRRDRIAFEVRDMRTDVNNTQTRSFSAAEISSGRVHGETAAGREITLDLRLPDHSGSMGQSSQAQTTWETKAGASLENMLARELHQNFNGDIVRHASIALRDGGAGTIKIALHPESLGNVKIQLEMTENKITGLIFVESEEALRAFRKEIASLEQAFRDSGFANADLDLSLTQNGQNPQERKEWDSFASRTSALRYDESSSFRDDGALLVEVLTGRNQGSVNMLA